METIPLSDLKQGLAQAGPERVRHWVEHPSAVHKPQPILPPGLANQGGLGFTGGLSDLYRMQMLQQQVVTPIASGWSSITAADTWTTQVYDPNLVKWWRNDL